MTLLLPLAIWCVSTSVEVGRKIGRGLRWLREVTKAPDFVDVNDRDRRLRLFGGYEDE